MPGSDAASPLDRIPSGVKLAAQMSPARLATAAKVPTSTPAPTAASPTPTSTPMSSTTIDGWNTYQNVKYAFSFQFPPGSTLSSQSDNSGRIYLPITGFNAATSCDWVASLFILTHLTASL